MSIHGSLGSRLVKVLRLVKDNPGVRPIEIYEAMGIECKVDRFKRFGLLKSDRGKYYILQKGLDVLEKADLEEAVLDYIKLHPGCSTKDIKRLFNVDSKYVHSLRLKKLVVGQMVDNHTLWFLAGHSGVPKEVKKKAKPKPKPKPKVEKKVEIPGITKPAEKPLWMTQCANFDSLVHDVVARRYM